MKLLTLIMALVCGLVIMAQDKVVVPVVDLGKDYPEKIICVDEIADIEYIPLETTNQSVIKEYGFVSMDASRIVVTDRFQNEIFIFGVDGKFINKISHRGGGPKEYQTIALSCVDFDNDRIYVWDYKPLGRIKVYDFSGRYIKQINAGGAPWPDQMYVYDDSHLIVYCDPDNLSKIKTGNTPYKLINTTTGKVTPLNLTVQSQISRHHKEQDDDGNVSLAVLEFYPLTRAADNVIISDFSSPLAYELKNGKLIPVMKRIGGGRLSNGSLRFSSIQNLTSRQIVISSVDAILDKHTGTYEIGDDKTICYDMMDKSIFCVDFFFKDLNRSLGIGSWNRDMPKNTAVCFISMNLLEKLHNQGKLSDKLEHLYSTLDEEANSVLLKVTFNK